MKIIGVILSFLLCTGVAHAQNCPVPNTFINGTIIDANQVNANFAALTNCSLNALHVSTNAALSASPSTTYPHGVWRDDFSTNLGAPPLFYVNSGTACSAPDNGAQVPSSDAKCWIAQFPGGGADAREWGTKFDNSTDNSTALQAAFTWMARGNTVIIPPQASLAKFSTPVTVTMAGYGNVIGTAREQSVLGYSGSGTAITITVPSAAIGVQMADLTVCSTTAGTASTGIQLTFTGTYSGNPVTSSFDRFTLRGCDGPLKTDYFGGAAFIDTGVSGVHWNALSIFGAGTTIAAGANGLLIQGLVGSSTYSVNNYIDGASQFVNLDKSFTYGSFVQGVFISDTFFSTFGYAGTLGTGIYSAASQSGIGAGLWLSNVTFGVNNSAINLLTAIDAISIWGGNAQVQVNNNGTEFNFPNWGGGTISGVSFTNPGNLTGITYISINGGGTLAGTVTGNAFNGPAANAISYGSSATGVSQCSNSFASTITNQVSFTSGASVTFCDAPLQFGSMLTGSALNTPEYIGGGANGSEAAVGLFPKPGGFVHDLYCISDQAAGASQSYVLTFNIGGSDKALFCTITGLSANSCSDTDLSHSVPLTAPNTTAVHMVPTATAATGTHFNCSARQATP